jgi:ubiquinone/menaquinone biosynthesis C-methylase UbiE
MDGPARDGNVAKAAAENYERHFVPAIGRPMAEDLVAAADLRPGERVLDVACGTGVVARLAADRVGPDGSVAGLDPNPGMLAVARESVPAEAAVDWHEAAAESIPLPDGSFDVVLCGMGLQFFSDRAAGLREIRRVLTPGGRLVASLPGPVPAPLEIMAEELSRHVGAEAAAFVHTVFSLNDADEIRALAADAGFRDVDVRASPKQLRLPPPEDFLWQYVASTPLAAAVAQVGDDERARLESAYARRCRPHVEDGALTGEVTMTTVTAER